MEFGITTYMAQVKKLVNEQGILTLPNAQKCKLPQETIDEVVLFYKSDSWKNGYKTVLKNDRRVQEQKYLALCNLKEAYKFYELRPKEYILAVNASTYCVCICTIH